MRLNFLLPFCAGVLIVSTCFMPWMTVESKGITITGIHTEGTLYGKPAYFHFIWLAMAFLFLLIGRGWSQKVALFFAVLNLAWAGRNFLLIPACQMGDCPVRKIGLYLLFFSSLLLLLLIALPSRRTKVYKE